jgi:hypothetical protein
LLARGFPKVNGAGDEGSSTTFAASLRGAAVISSTSGEEGAVDSLTVATTCFAGASAGSSLRRFRAGDSPEGLEANRLAKLLSFPDTESRRSSISSASVMLKLVFAVAVNSSSVSKSLVTALLEYSCPLLNRFFFRGGPCSGL